MADSRVVTASMEPHEVNLLNDLETLGALLQPAAREGNSLDTFLFAAGINQIAEDYLHDSPYLFDQAAAMFRDFGSTPTRIAASLLAGIGVSLRTLRGRRLAERRTLDWQQGMAGLVEELAAAVVATEPEPEPLPDRCEQLVRNIPCLPAGLARAVVRLPSCFYDFDQRPEDCERLAQLFIDLWPERKRPLLVVGVRTSGSYLAPLIAAGLRKRGCIHVRAITIRPGRALLAHERALVRSVVRAAGQVLLTDDSPVTGSSMAAAAKQLKDQGVTSGMLRLLFSAEDGHEGLPETLQRYEAITLPPGEWTIARRLRREAVESALAKLLEGELELRSLDPVPLPAGARRRAHRRALFRVRGVAADGAPRQFEVLAEATGVGYLGTHHVAVARALSAFAPRVLGFEDGVLYREWLPDHRRLPDSSDEFAAAVARYVATRRRTLRVARDVSAAMPGQRPVWEVVALILARGFAPAAPAMRAALVNRAVRRLLAVEHPSVVDGSMSRQHWFQGEEDGRVVKVSLSDRSYWRLGLTCFDASFDLAGAASGSSNGDLAAQVRDAWLTQTGEQVDPERWLLYELAHLWGLARRDPAREVEVRQASARAVARYFAGRFLADLDRPGTGPLCALDIDGVLEAGRLTFPTLTRASATALRALLTHGYRPVLATGRGIAEVRDRCRIYGLEGGVAEYGSAIYVARGDRSISLVDAESAAALSRLQAALRERAGASFDPGFRHALRAYNVRADGRPRPLDPGEAAACLDASDTATAVRAIPGENQTDFVPVAFDKGTGLRALIAALEASGGSESASALAMAVGDTAADAPMLALASAAFVPAHATHAAATTGARRVARPYQAGLHAAVGELLGHPPGSCRCCCVMPSTRESEVLVDLLSVSEDGARGFPLKTLRLMWKLR